MLTLVNFRCPGVKGVMLLTVVICVSEVLRTLLACNFVVHVFRYIQDPEQ